MNRHIKYLLPAAALLLALSGCAGGNSDFRLSKENVTDLVAEGESLFEDGSYEESLETYLEAMQKNPKDMAARFGVVHCQMAMKNYSLAAQNLSAAVDVSPTEPEIYDLYVELSKESNSISYARTAVSLAMQYNQTDFLAKVPAKPTITVKSGDYDAAQKVEIVNNDPDATLYYSYSNSNYGGTSSDIQYAMPVNVVSGTTTLNAYCVKDGIPSETVSKVYNCSYPAAPVTFEDPVMELLVRAQIGKPTGSVTNLDCEQLTSLYYYNLSSIVEDYREREALRVHTLNDLQMMPNLMSISLSQQDEISDFSGLLNCPALTSVTLSNCGLQNIDFVPYVPNLRSLSVANNAIRDISPLANAAQLSSLNVNGNPVTDLSMLSDMQNLYYLGVDGEQLASITNFESLKGITSLDLNGWNGVDLNVLTNFPDLSSLYIYYPSSYDYNNRPVISDLSFLEQLPHLRYLYLSGVTDSSQFEHIKPLKELTYLALYNCPAVDSDPDVLGELQAALPNCSISG